MTQRVEFEGQTHEFPDDFSDKDVASALGQVGTENKVSQAIASVPKPPSLPQLGSLTKDAGGKLRGPMAPSISNVSDTSESGLETGNLVSENPKENQTNPIIPSMTDPTGRAVGRSVEHVKNTLLGVIPATIHAFADKPQDADEQTIANAQGPMSNIPAPIKLAIARMGKPAINAAQDYSAGKVSMEDALNVAPEALGDAAGQVIAGKAMDSAIGGVPKVLKPIKDYVPQRIYNAIVGTSPKGFNYGRNPGQGVADTGEMAWSKSGMLDKIRAQQEQAGKAIDLHLSDPAVNRPIVDLRSSINDTIRDAQKEALQGKQLELAEKLSDLRTRLVSQHDFDPNGKVIITGPEKLSGLTPLEANSFKQRVGQLTRWTGDPAVDKMAPTVQKIYGRINDQIEGAAPGIKGINQKYGELKSAAEALDHKIRLGSKYSITGSLTDKGAAAVAGLKGYALSKTARSVPFTSAIGQAARMIPDEIPQPIPGAIGAAIAAPKEKKK